MKISNLPPEVQKLTTLSYDSRSGPWTDYQKLGIGPQHIPALIEISRSAPDFWREDASDEEFNMPLHAWRALVQIQAPQAVPELLNALQWIWDESNDSLIVEEFPFIFNRLEPSSAGPLIEYFLNRQNDKTARICVGEGLMFLAQQRPEFREEVVRVFHTALEHYEEETLYFNGFNIAHLAELNAVESDPLVERAYKDNRVDESIMGDWEDFQVRVGLIDKKQLPKTEPAPFQNIFVGDLADLPITTPYPNFGESSTEEQKWKELDKRRKKKEKEKRKQAKSARKKHKKK